jgi:hypothetical protein
MSLQWVDVSLRGWKPGAVTGEEFFASLGLKPEDGFAAEPGDRPGKTAKVVLAFAERQPEKGCVGQVEVQLRRAAQWLSSRPPGVFDSLRAQGLKLDVFVGGWIDGDQMDLSFPPEFLLACGQAGLGIEIYTND